MQASFAQMGTPLSEVVFVVVDLETTGGPPGADAITEIGAVRVRGGAVESEMSTLVNPGRAIPAQITVLTGITNAMVAGAPPVGEALSTFLAWARLDGESTVLVAHNARFDVGHLRGAARALGLGWSEPTVLDTLGLARRAWSRADVPDHKLGTLAALVGSPIRPAHRALGDARATVDVLHAALEVLAPLGVTHLEDLATAADPVPARRRAKSRLADGLPSSPGVYQFLSAAGQVLYVGSAVDLRRRVRSYFTAAEKRSRIANMLDTTVQVRAIPTPTEIEARVRELRLIAELDPPVNRRSRSPRSRPWLRPVGGPRPRLAATTVLTLAQADGAVGPFPSRAALAQARRAVESALGLHPWDDPGVRTAGSDGAGASAGAVTGATAGISDGAEAEVPDGDAAAGAPAGAEAVRLALSGRVDLVALPLLERISALAAVERFEEAGMWTARLRSLLLAACRAEKARPLLACPHLIAARRRPGGGWELVAVRWGRLAGSAITPPGADPRPAVRALRATAEVVAPPSRVGAAAGVEETLLLADWALDAGARIVEVDGGKEGAARVLERLSWPVGAAARHRRIIDAVG